METNSGAPKIVCFCNDVPERKVVECIRLGAKTLGQIYDQTQAGSGPCGGSCRDMIKALIAQGSSSSSNASAATPETEAQPSELVHGISLFNRRYFWEAHEVLEEIWLVEHGPRKTLYQGIIQAAACFYHVLNANPKGALKLSQDAKTKLDPFRPRHMGVELDLLCDRLEIFYLECKEILGGTRSGFTYDLLPKIRNSNEMEL